jgi:hypothetical protein
MDGPDELAKWANDAQLQVFSMDFSAGSIPGASTSVSYRKGMRRSS